MADSPHKGARGPRDYLAFALDVPNLKEARRYIEILSREVGVIKVGLELFTAAGPEAVRLVRDCGCACFLDLKLHDIPTTMGRAVRTASELGVAYLTIHALGGPEGLRAAVEASGKGGVRLLAVTLLTSMGESSLQAIGLQESVETSVKRLARLARECGIGGFVSSSRECAALRAHLGADVFLVAPGIRPSGDKAGDQVRTATAAEAIAAGADLLVVGRPIRDAVDPAVAAKALVREIAMALQSR